MQRCSQERAQSNHEQCTGRVGKSGPLRLARGEGRVRLIWLPVGQPGQACSKAPISSSNSRLILPAAFADGGKSGFSGSCLPISTFA
jgi:hypothetical protein